MVYPVEEEERIDDDDDRDSPGELPSSVSITLDPNLTPPNSYMIY